MPPEARWAHLKGRAKQSTIGRLVDDAMTGIERDNPTLKGVLPKDYARPALDKTRLGQLIDLISNIKVGDEASRAKDVLGRVYEYFLSQFASAEGKKGGVFYTPRCVVKLLVEMLEPYRGRVYDPCCGSSGMFVQSVEFIRAHAKGNGNGGKARADISIYGQESNYTTWRLAKMNLAIRGIDGQIAHGDTFHNDRHPDLRADFILANPPFNVSDWGGERLRDDKRWQYGAPPAGNANFAWVQHIVHHLAPAGVAGFVLANGSMSSNQSGEGEIRKSLIEADLVAIRGRRIDHSILPHVTSGKAQELARHRLQTGDILFARRGVQATGHIGYVRDAEDGFLCGTGAIRLRVNRAAGALDPDFLSHVLADPASVEWFKFHAIGATMPNLNEGIIGSFPLGVPPLDEQRAIAHILGTLDDKIELIRRMSETLEAMARALFKSWFVDFDPVRAKPETRDHSLPKPLADLFPARLVDSELGEIPEGWKVGSILDHARLMNGGTPKTRRPEYWDGLISWASAKDVSQARDCLLVETERTITDQGLEESATQVVPAFCSAVVARGATTGRMVLFGRDMAMNQTCYALATKTGTPFALYCRLRDEMDALVHAAHGSVFDTITNDEHIRIFASGPAARTCIEDLRSLRRACLQAHAGSHLREPHPSRPARYAAAEAHLR